LVMALDPLTGQQLWQTSFPTNYSSSIAPDNGPRCVPLIHTDKVIVLGAGGDLHCLDFATGKTLWSRELYQEFSAPEGYFGAGSSPIVEGDKVLVNVGGKGAGIVAMSLATGAVVWKATEEAASYSSPVAVTIEGQRHVIFVTRFNVVSVNPDSGAVRFRFAFGMRGPTVNAASPVVFDKYVFVTSSYGIGAQLAVASGIGAKKVWANDDVLSSQYTTPVVQANTLYGIDGRQDQGVAQLRAVTPVSGRVNWTEENFGSGTLILADRKLLIMKTDGKLVLAAAAPERYRELAAAKLFPSTVQALPALAGGRFYARDARTLKCFQLGEKP
jgi:outer membrane protein assembly factor BamB